MKKNSRVIVVALIILIIVAAVLGILLYNREHKVKETKQEAKELVEESVSIDEFKEKTGGSWFKNRFRNRKYRM